MSPVAVTGSTNGADDGIESVTTKIPLPEAALATLALHADDPLNVVDDVAPPMHVSTTFRYPHDPAQLIPFADRTVLLALPP